MLRTDAGWGFPPEEAVTTALQNTLFGACAETVDGQTIGMGRITGDGGVQFFITDVIVRKDWHNRGVGTRIMTALMRYIHAHAVPGCFVGLFSAVGREKFYERFGFVIRPNGHYGAGMSFWTQRRG